MNIYNTDIKKMAVQWLPMALRTRLMVVFATVMQRGGAAQLQALVKHRDEMIYRLTHNGQVCHLRAVLNDEFDPTLRRIEIYDVDSKQAATIYHRGSDSTFYVSNEPYRLARRGFGGAAGYDFGIAMPFALSSSEMAQLRALVDTYKLSSKRYVV